VFALLLALAVASATPPAPTQRPAPTHFLWPADGTVTTPFAPGGHPGLDIGILQSLTVRASAAGRVRLVGEQPGYEGYGRIVLVAVGGGYSTLYAHLSRFSVQPGDEVAAGQRLGIAGCTGWCTGTHLHYELRLNGVAVPPRLSP
jgi:murein DD-endopeptidase MepM/ murein hydrolase activator NlpD